MTPSTAKTKTTEPAQPSRDVAARRVRCADRGSAPGVYVETLSDGWVLWEGSDGVTHLSHPSFVTLEGARP